MAHGHTHDQIDWGQRAAHLGAWDRALAGLYREMVGWLGVAPGMRVAEVGGGAGGFAAAVAEQIGRDGRITLIDGDAELLALAERTQPAHVSVSTIHADLENAQLASQLTERFDLVHAAGVVHHTDDQRRTVDDLVGLLAPGGRLVLGEGGLATRYLPSECGIGAPDLEARLHAALTAWFWTDVRPAGATVASDRGWGSMLQAAGLVDVTSRSFLLDIPPPLTAELRTLVATSLAEAAERAAPRLAPDDRAALAALVDPARDDGVHHRPDVFILGARTLHVGAAAPP
jgi:SAM-dependent methyltransferase